MTWCVFTAFLHTPSHSAYSNLLISLSASRLFQFNQHFSLFFSPSDWDFSFGFCCHADSDLFIYFCYRTMFAKVLKASLVSLTRLVVVPFQPFFSHPLFLFLCLKYSGLVTFSKLSWFYPSQYQLSIVIFQPAFRKNAAAAAYQDFATLKYTKKKPDLMQHLLQ